MILSHIPGRIRIQLPGPAELNPSLALLEETKGVTAVQANPRTLTLLAHYDPRVLPPEQITGLLEKTGPKVRKPARRRGPSGMRTAKRGMASCLGVSLMAALLGREKIHLASGGLFTLLLGYHLYIYRKRLFL
nr:cation transporter [Desulfobacula sp.]